MKVLINSDNVDVNLKGKFDLWNETPLYVAVEKSNTEIVTILLSSPKINVNIKRSYYNGEEDETALHLAVKKKSIHIIMLLLKHQGIDINALDKYGKKPIDYAENDENITQLFAF